MNKPRKTKWTTVVRNGDLIQLGNVRLTVVKDATTNGNVSIIVEAPATTKITKQEHGNGNTPL